MTMSTNVLHATPLVSRRAPWIVLLALTSLLAIGTARADADADAASEAKTFLRAFSEQAIDMIADDGLSDDERARKFRRLLQENFDMPLIGRAVLGRYWHTATPEQRKEFVGLFEDFIVQFYGHRLSSAYSGETIELGAAHVRAKDARVRSRVVNPKGPALAVDWQMRRSDDGWRIVDVVIEGVSMTITHRSEFGAVISNNRGGIERLLQALRNKTDKTTTAEAGT